MLAIGNSVIFNSMRIVSLLASGTEIVCGLGLGDQLVGISHECDFPPEALGKPRVSRPRFDPASLSSGEIDAAVRQAMAEHGSVYQLDETLLRQLEPDLILTQAVCDVCAVPTSLAERACAALPEARVLSLDAHRVAEVFASIRGVAEAAGVTGRGARYVSMLEARVAAVGERVSELPRPRVMAIEWLDPPFVPGHWTPEMVQLAGGANLFGRAGVPSAETTWEELAGADPDVLIMMPCGYRLGVARADADRYADQLTSIAPRAVEAGRAFVVDGSAYFNRSGPRLVNGIEILGKLFHSERFPDCDLRGSAEQWRPVCSRSREVTP